MSRHAFAAAAAGSGIVTYKPATISSSTSALQDAGGSRISALAQRKQSLANGDADDGEERKAEADGSDSHLRKRQKLGGAPISVQTTERSVSEGAWHLATSASSAPPAAAAVPPALFIGDHGAVDDEPMEEEDFFALMESAGPPSARLHSGATPLPAYRALEPLPVATAAVPSGDGIAWADMSFSSAPLDWNLHSRVRITSPHPFAWAATPDRLMEAEGFNAYLTQPADSPCDCASTSPLREFHHALQYSVFPTTPFSKTSPVTMAIQSALNKPLDSHGQMERLSMALLRKTWAQWEDSFASLYSRLRLPANSPAWLDHFYSVHRGGGGAGASGLLSYTVCFFAADYELDEADLGPAAVISRSNRGLRAFLAAKKVAFAMPNSSSRASLAAGLAGQPPFDRAHSEHSSAAAAGWADPALSMMEEHSAPPASLLAGGGKTPTAAQQRLNKLMAEEDMTAASVLLVRGRKDVHALFDALLTQDRDRRELDMPTLLASRPFVNAATQALNVVRLGVGTSASGSGSGGGGGEASTIKSANVNSSSSFAHSSGLSSLHHLELAGPLLPASVSRLFTLLQQTQKGSFTASFIPSDFPCNHMNNISSIIQMDSIRNQPGILGLCKQESLAKTSTNGMIHGRRSIRTIGALKRVKAEGENFFVELATNTH